MSSDVDREPVPGIELRRLEDALDWVEGSVRKKLGDPAAHLAEITVTLVIVRGHLTRWIGNPQVSHEDPIERDERSGQPVVVEDGH